MTASLADRLLEAGNAGAGPCGCGPGGVSGRPGPSVRIMPPTYPASNGERDPDARYLMDGRLVDGEHACWWRGFGRRRTAGGIERPWSGAQPATSRPW